MSSVHIRTWLALRWLLPAVLRKISDFMHNVSFSWISVRFYSKFLSIDLIITEVSFFVQFTKTQLITFQNFNIQTCFSQFLWFFSLKCWFKGQIISRIHLSLPNAYKLMCFGRNINGNRVVKFWIGIIGHCTDERNLLYLPTSFCKRSFESPLRKVSKCRRLIGLVVTSYCVTSATNKMIW